LRRDSSAPVINEGKIEPSSKTIPLSNRINSPTEIPTTTSISIKQCFVFIFGFFIIQITSSFILSVLHGLLIGFEFALAEGAKNAKPQALSAVIRDTSSSSITETIIMSYLLATLWAVWYARHMLNCSTTTELLVRLSYNRTFRRYYGYAFGIALLSFGIICTLTYFFPPRHSADAALNSIGHTGPSGLLVMAIFSISAVPLAEEFIFRSVAFGSLQTAMRPRAAVAVTAIFVLAHAPEKIHYPLGLWAILVLATGAIWLRVKSNSVWPPTLFHALYNFGVIIAAIIFSGHIN
jgi:membrane protease YdiL (CAAX protease family)